MTKRTTTTLLLVAALLVGCGSDDERGEPIPASAAAELDGQLASIQDRFAFPGGAACSDITQGDDPNTTKVQTIIDALPEDVDADTRDALQQSFDRLFELVEQECGEEQPETETETVPEPPPETETVPPETETIPPETETVPPPTEEEPPLETEPPVEPPADEDDGTGGGGVISPGDEG